MLVASKFFESLIIKYIHHPVYSYGGTWYPEACSTMGLKQYPHSQYERPLLGNRERISISRLGKF